MAVPKPRDPHAVTEPSVLDAQVAEVFAVQPESLKDEYLQLDQAHMLLRDALQEN
ncbi:hypothetical protein [Corynebacterium phocae]|uniref:hypothetical protein n=1 Tax=Corynebacterium phocae TaxID=161895 RepID=UPI001470D14D|nr:hypothetical protein [Corynebacterium phocae]